MWWFWTILAIVIALVGVVGTFLPALPGSSLIFAAAVLHRLMTGGVQSVGWITIAGLGLMALLSVVVDFLTGAAGAKWFGSGKWGLWGGIAGAVVGLFFGLPGLLLGPLLGALLFELISGKKIHQATKAGIGTFLGTTAGMIGKVFIALAMFLWFLFDLFL